MPLYQIQRDQSAYWQAGDVFAFVEPGTVEQAARNVWESERSDPTEWNCRWRVAVWADESLDIPRDLILWKSGPNNSGVPDPDLVVDGDTIAYDHVAGTGERCLTVAASWDEFAVGDFLVGGNGPELYVVVEPFPAPSDGVVHVRKYAARELPAAEIGPLYYNNTLHEYGYGFFCFTAPERPYHKVVRFL
jgi:hypothetical protein